MVNTLLDTMQMVWKEQARESLCQTKDTKVRGAILTSRALQKSQSIPLFINSTMVAVGILIVGIGGNNGVTLLAGQIANRLSLTWETLTGPMSANW